MFKYFLILLCIISIERYCHMPIHDLSYEIQKLVQNLQKSNKFRNFHINSALPYLYYFYDILISHSKIKFIIIIYYLFCE